MLSWEFLARVVFQIAGPMGIEERFQDAFGIPHDAGNVPGDSGVPGFSLEDQPLLNAVVLCVLGIICIAAYRHFTPMSGQRSLSYYPDTILCIRYMTPGFFLFIG